MSKLLTTKEAAAIIGCTPNHVNHLCRYSLLPARKSEERVHGKRIWLIRLEDARAYRPAERKPAQPAVKRWSPVGKAATEPGASDTPAAGAVTRTRFPQQEHKINLRRGRDLILTGVRVAGGK